MRIVLIILSALLLNLTPSYSPVDSADLVFKNGNIYTANESMPRAQAVAVKGDRIVFVGSNDAVQKLVGKDTRVVDLHGNTVLPGITDAHHHLSGVGFREMTLNLEGITNLQDFLAKVNARAEQTKPGEWISGRGWIETFWKPPIFPTRWDLDKVTPNNPAFFTRADGHALVANSAALKLSGIDKNTASPFGGEILKDKQSGEPTGMLIDAAQGLLRSQVPSTTAADAERAIILGVKRDIELGWVE